MKITHGALKMHQEVLNNLESIHGALLRMNRSIQAEGAFGVIKYNRWVQKIGSKRSDQGQSGDFLSFNRLQPPQIL